MTDPSPALTSADAYLNWLRIHGHDERHARRYWFIGPGGVLSYYGRPT